MMLLAASGGGKPAGLIAFGIVVAMAVALFFLIRSMNKHVRRARENLGGTPPTPPPPREPPPG